MKEKTIVELLEQAVSEGIIEIQCPECGGQSPQSPTQRSFSARSLILSLAFL